VLNFDNETAAFGPPELEGLALSARGAGFPDPVFFFQKRELF